MMMMNGVSNMNRKSQQQQQQSPGGAAGHQPSNQMHQHHHIGPPPPPPGDHPHKTPLSVNVGGGGGQNANGGGLDSPAEGLPPRNAILPPLDKPPRVGDSDAAGGYYRHSRNMGHGNEDEEGHGLGPLPYKWEKAYTESGEAYFIDHNTGTSHWLDPRLSKYQKKSLEDCRDDELPYGWEKINDPQYGTYFIDHVNRRTQYENPVLEAKRRLERQSTTASSGTPLNSTLERGVGGRNNNRNDSLLVDGSGNNGAVGLDDEGGSTEEGGGGGGKDSHFTRNPAELCGERLTTTLLKSSRGLGFTIVGGDDNVDEFLQIKSIVPNGPAWLDGKLLTGDVLVYVNDTCVLGFNHHEMVNVFQSILPGETVTLEVCRGYPLPFDPNDPNTEVVTTIAVNRSYIKEDASVYGGHDNGLLGQGRKFIPPYMGIGGGGGGNNGGGYGGHRNGGGGGVFFDDNLKTLGQQNPSPMPMERAPAEILLIQIVKGAMGFGFTIADSATGQRVKKILDRTCCKTLQEGDILLAINAISLHGLTHTEVVQVLKECAVGQEALVKIQRGGGGGAANLGYGQQQPQSGGKGLNLNAMGKFNGGGGGLKKMFSKEGNLFRSKTPTADLYSTQQKEVLPIRPKTPLVDTRVRSKTPSHELTMMNLDAINNNKSNSKSSNSISGAGKGSQKSLANKSHQGDLEDDEEEEEEDVDGIGAAVNDDELDSVLKELEVMENKNSNGGGHHNQDAKSTASYADHDSINNDLMPYSMDPYPKMMGQLSERLQEATITGPGAAASTYLTDNPAMMYHSNQGTNPQQQHFMQMRNGGGGGMDSVSVNSMNMGLGQGSVGGHNRLASKMYHHHSNQMSSSQSDLTYEGQMGRTGGGGGGGGDNHPYGNQSIYANTMGMASVAQAAMGRAPAGAAGGRMANGTAAANINGGLYSMPAIPIMPPIPTYHQDSCYCFECEDYHRQQQEYNLHMQNQIQLQNLMQNRAPSSMSNPYARKEYAMMDNRRGGGGGGNMSSGMMWPKGGGSDAGMDGSPGEFSLSEVTLERQSLGFGFRIVGGTEEGSQVTVGHIVPGGAADLDPRITTGDEILSIDGVNVIGASHHRVVQLMGEAGARGRVTMILRRRMGPNGANGLMMNADMGGLNSPGVPLLSQVSNAQSFRFPYDVIVSRNENEGFGFVIISSTNQYYGATIGKLIPGSPADRCTELKVGDRIVAVNRMDIAGMNHGEIVNLIKESGLHVRLTIGQPMAPPVLSPPPSQQPQLSMHQINLQQQALNKNDLYFDRYPPQQL